MAGADPWWKRALAGLVASLKSQWLAGALLIPIGLLIANAYVANQQAREARVQAVNVDRIAKVQDSGKQLDLAVAAYFEAIAELGLAEKHLRIPGTYADVPLDKAQAAVVDTRKEARKALADHGSDVQSLRGSLDPVESERYLAALSGINSTVEGSADITRTGANITALSRLVVARNALVDQAMKKVG